MGRHAPKGRVLALDSGHGIVDELPDVRLLGVGLQEVPAGLSRKPRHVGLGVVVTVVEGRLPELRVLEIEDASWVGNFDRGLAATMLEGLGDELEEDQPEDEVLVSSFLNLAAELGRRGPQLCLER